MSLSPYKLMLRIACGSEITLISEEDVIPLMNFSNVSYTSLSGAANGQLSIGYSIQDGV